MDLESRQQVAVDATRAGAQLALKYYQAIDSLVIEEKGHQDLVSNGDREVEQLVRRHLADHFPDDGIIGEEYDNKPSATGFNWVIDPIDGTASFVRGRPGWCVVIAGVYNGETVIAVIHDAVANEVFEAVKGGGARLNARPIAPSPSRGLADGAVGVGFSNRFPSHLCTQLLQRLIVEKQGVFYQNGSGALMLSYVACGRLIGYAEPHMNPWDCLAALLLIEEAGGRVQPYDAVTMLEHGERVVAACAGIYDQLVELTDDTYGDFRLVPDA
jgi:myo-inositol-1(or 4)-monophosphatase